MGFKRQMRAEIDRLNTEILNLKGRVSPTVESSIVTQNTPQPDMQNSLATVIRWFNLTSVTTNPMVGTMQRFDPNAGPAAWIDHNLIDKDVYAHPESVFGDYTEGLCACVFVGGRWWAVNQHNEGGGGGGGAGVEIHAVFPVANASGGDTTDISCYVDTDHVGDPVDVNVEIEGGGGLGSAIPRLSNGTRFYAEKLGEIYYSTTVFHSSEDCVCEEPE